MTFCPTTSAGQKRCAVECAASVNEESSAFAGEERVAQVAFSLWVVRGTWIQITQMTAATRRQKGHRGPQGAGLIGGGRRPRPEARGLGARGQRAEGSAGLQRG